MVRMSQAASPIVGRRVIRYLWQISFLLRFRQSLTTLDHYAPFWTTLRPILLGDDPNLKSMAGMAAWSTTGPLMSIVFLP